MIAMARREPEWRQRARLWVRGHVGSAKLHDDRPTGSLGTRRLLARSE